MNSYKYKAIDGKGKYIKGFYDCDNEVELGKNLRKEGYYLLKYSVYKSKNSMRFFGKKLTGRDTSILCRNISSLLAAGVNIVNILQMLYKQSKDKEIKNILYKIELEVQKGNSFYESIKKFDYFFPKFMIEMIEVGERSGCLQTVMLNLAQYYEKIDTQQRKIKSAMSYPTIVFVLTVVICNFIITNIIPMFANTICSLQGKIPNSTQRLINISSFLKFNQMKLIFLSILMIVITYFFDLSPKGKYFVQRIKYKLPLLGSLSKKIWEMRFASSMSIMLDKGLNVIRALEIEENTAGGCVKECLKKCSKDIREGNSLFESLKKIEFASPTLLSLIQIGEKSGEVDNMFYKASKIIEEDINFVIEKVSKYIEPIMISVMAVIVGMLVFSFMLPVFNIMDSLG